MNKEDTLEKIVESLKDNFVSRYGREPNEVDLTKINEWAQVVLGKRKDFTIFNILDKDRGPVYE